MPSIGIVGECMVELFDKGNGLCERRFGGDTLNTAVYLARCAKSAVEVHYVSILGDDPLSQDMLEQWQAEGIMVDTVEQQSGQVPGLYMIQTDENGERSFLYWRDKAPIKQLLQTDNAHKLSQQLLSFDWLYYSGITLAILDTKGREKLLTLLEQFRQQGGKVVFDNNYRPRLWEPNEAQYWFEAAYQQCDLALPSEEDECDLWGNAESAEILQRLSDWGCQEIVLKRSSKPCLVSSNGSVTEYTTAAAATVVDTTAAGDSFNGAYLASRLQNHAISKAVKAGQDVAKQVIAQQGAIVPITI